MSGGAIEAPVFRSPAFHFVWHGQRGPHVAAIVGVHLRDMAALHPPRGRLTRQSSSPVQSAVLLVHSHVLSALLNLDADRGRELCVVA